MKDRMNGAVTYVKKEPDGSFAPYMKLPGMNEYMCPGAHTFATEKGADAWLEKWEKTHRIVKSGLGWRVDTVFGF